MTAIEKKKLAITLVTLLFVATGRAADLYSTFHFSPDLANEANPLVTVLGVSPSGLITTNILATLLFSIIPLLIYLRFPQRRLAAPPKTLASFMSQQLYRDDVPKFQLIKRLLVGWPIPKDLVQVTRAFGVIGSWFLILISFTAAFSWWAINDWQFETYVVYRELISIRNYPVTEFIPVIVVTHFVAYFYFRGEFRSAQSPNPKDSF